MLLRPEDPIAAGTVLGSSSLSDRDPGVVEAVRVSKERVGRREPTIEEFVPLVTDADRATRVGTSDRLETGIRPTERFSGPFYAACRSTSYLFQ